MSLKGRRWEQPGNPKMGTGRSKKHRDLTRWERTRETPTLPFGSSPPSNFGMQHPRGGFGEVGQGREGLPHPPVALGIPEASLHPWEGEDEDGEGGISPSLPKIPGKSSAAVSAGWAGKAAERKKAGAGFVVVFLLYFAFPSVR